MKRIARSIRHGHGASTTESLVVLVLGLLIVGGAVAVLAPGLTVAAAGALEPLGVTWTPAEPESTNAIWYVVFAFLAVGFAAVFVAPLLLPKARTKRETVLASMSGTFPILQVFVDQDARSDAGLNELRHLRDEVNRIQGTPMGGVPAVKGNLEHPIAIDSPGIGTSEEPTISRNTPQAGLPAANAKPYQTGKEAAIASVPTLEPLGTPSEEPTVQVSKERVAEALAGGQAGLRAAEKGAPVIRRLEGVRAADYKAPEPVVGDLDQTLVRSGSGGAPAFPNDFDDLDAPTNVIADRQSILQRAAAMPGADDPTQRRDAPGTDDLRTTVAQPVDPAGPDATTNVKIES